MISKPKQKHTQLATQSVTTCIFSGRYLPTLVNLCIYKKNPRNNKEKLFSKQQEGCRKDVERVFACLLQKFQVLQKDVRLWYIPAITNILNACIIMHNMCVVDRINKVGQTQYHLEILSAFADSRVEDPFEKNATIFSYEARKDQVNDEGVNASAESIFRTDSSFRDTAMHDSILNDLIQNLWEKRKFYNLYNPLHATYEDDV